MFPAFLFLWGSSDCVLYVYLGAPLAGDDGQLVDIHITELFSQGSGWGHTYVVLVEPPLAPVILNPGG